MSKQRPDGGWGESYKACEIHEWVDHTESQVVQTAWAILALMAADYPVEMVIRRGIMVSLISSLPDVAYSTAHYETPTKEWRVEAGSDRGCLQQGQSLFCYLGSYSNQSRTA